MIDYLEKLLSAVRSLRPGLVRHGQERALLSRALGASYRTPSNHHLRRALRLSWIRALGTFVSHRIEWAKRHPDDQVAQDILRFEPAFEAICGEVQRDACNQDSGAALPASVIDASLEAVVRQLPEHLKGGPVPASELRLEETLLALSGWKLKELPAALLRDARDGITAEGTERRTFAQMLLDEFARCVQDPKYYPEAGASFHVVQQGAMMLLLEQSRMELLQEIRSLPEQVSVKFRAELEAMNIGEFYELLKTIQTDFRRDMQDLHKALVPVGGSVTALVPAAPQRAPTQAAHQPVQPRTIVFAGFAAAKGVQALLAEASDQMGRRASRLPETEAVTSLVWDLSLSTEREAPDSEYAQTEAWKTLDDKVIGGVLVLAEQSGRPISPDVEFLEQLEGWGAANELKGRFRDMSRESAQRQIDFHREGGIAVSYESRFALECLLRRKSLLVIVADQPKQRGRQVSNLVDFLSRQGVVILQGAALACDLDWIEDYLSTLPGISFGGPANPYRGLDYYRIEDAEMFRGRAAEAAAVLVHLQAGGPDGGGALVGISGPSGCGKSSFLRAKVAARAAQELGLRPVELRPTHFRDEDATRLRCLPVLCAAIAETLKLTPPPDLVGPHALFRVVHLREFKKWLGRVLDPATPRVLLCLDQCEEILDDLSEGVYAADWQALLAIVWHLRVRHGWPVVFTLEDSRRERFDRLASELGLAGARMVALPDDDESFYRCVIEEPFRKARIELDPAIIDELLAGVRALRDGEGSKASPLPLLSLRLHALFRKLAPRAPKAATSSVLAGAFPPLPVARADLGGISLALGDMVESLAEEAWAAGGGKDDLQSIQCFLRPLVRISLDPDRPEEAKLVLQNVQKRGYREEQQIQEEFRWRRLLVPTADGLRLVHEAVIRRWSRAKAWYERDLKELEKEARFRTSALQWEDAGRPDVAMAGEEDIRLAATILRANLRDWNSENIATLTVETRALRRHALSVFERSSTPMAETAGDPVYTHLFVAASYGMEGLLERYQAAHPGIFHVQLCANGRTLLELAAWNHPSTVRYLLAAGVDPMARSKSGFCAFDGAVWAGRMDITQIFLPHIKPENWGDDRHNPLSGAAALGRRDLAEVLVQAGFRHDQASLEGWTPLLMAATRENVASFTYFLEHGDCSARSRGRSVVWLAAANGHTRHVRQLLARAEGYGLLNETDDGRLTPLMAAARYLKPGCVTYLLSVEAEPNTTSVNEQNALHLAVLQYDASRERAPDHLREATLNTVAALVACPSLHVAAKDKQGRTAWEMAAGLPEVQRLIAAHPLFPDDLLRELREKARNKGHERAVKALLEIARKGNRAEFETALQGEGLPQAIDRVYKDGDDITSLGEILLGKGWSDLLIPLIKAGRIQPWRDEDKYGGLYGPALKRDDAALIDCLEAQIPDGLPTRVARDVCMTLLHWQADQSRHYARALELLLSRLNPAQRAELLADAVKWGAIELYQALRARGIDEGWRDHWGRTPLEQGSDYFRQALGLAPIGVATSAGGDASFYPEAEGWTTLTDLARVAAIDKPDDFPLDNRAVWSARALSFYPRDEARLLRLRHPDWQAGLQLYWLQLGDSLFRLNGMSPPIHEMNSKCPIGLQEENVLDYLKFFCFFVHGDGSPFYIVDGPEARFLPEELRLAGEPFKLREGFRRAYRAPSHHGLTEQGHYRISALVHYSSGVFVADFQIQPTGMIEMKADYPVLVGLPCRVAAPLTLNKKAKR